MRTTVSVLSLLAMSLGTSALATTQLGGTIGIDTTGLTTAEIAQLKTAVENGDEARIGFILENNAATTPDVAATPGRVQMAEAMGVSPEEYTLAELTALMLEDMRKISARRNFAPKNL